MPSAETPQRWKTLSAFAIIYLVWGSTFLAIRVGVRDVPPFMYAAMRFLAAGALLYGWLSIRGERQPSARQWGSAFLLASMIFVCDYGLLFWAERRVPSGLAAVILATIPVFMTLSEIVILRKRTLTGRLALSLLIGIGGVAVLVIPSLSLGGAPVDAKGAIALTFSAASWAVASALTRMLPLPESKPMSSGSQMLAGGILLTIVSVLAGEFNGFHPGAVSRGAWIALAYLVVAGSILAYTVYLWLLHHESPTKVGTYAYVNPVVAVVLGYFFAGEPLGLRTVAGTALVLVSVIAITLSRERAPQRTPQPSAIPHASQTAGR